MFSFSQFLRIRSVPVVMAIVLASMFLACGGDEPMQTPGPSSSEGSSPTPTATSTGATASPVATAERITAAPSPTTGAAAESATPMARATRPAATQTPMARATRPAATQTPMAGATRPAATQTAPESATPTLGPTAAPAPLPGSPEYREASEREALATLFNATDGPNWDSSDNWLSDAPLSEWFGVTTDNSGSVVGLDLSWIGLNGELPEELGKLRNLETLLLDGNYLSDCIPSTGSV